MLLSNVPAAGTFLAISPKTDAGGSVAMDIPVVPAVGYYATLAPPPAPAPAAPPPRPPGPPPPAARAPFPPRPRSCPPPRDAPAARAQ